MHSKVLILKEGNTFWADKIKEKVFVFIDNGTNSVLHELSLPFIILKEIPYEPTNNRRQKL